MCGGHAGESTPHLEFVHNGSDCSQHRVVNPCETVCSGEDGNHDHETDHEQECEDEAIELTQVRPNQNGELTDALPAPIFSHLLACEAVFTEANTPSLFAQRTAAIPPDEPAVLRTVCLII